MTGERRTLVTSFDQLGTGKLIESGPCIRCSRVHRGILGNRRDDLYDAGGAGPPQSGYWLDPPPPCLTGMRMMVTESDVAARSIYLIDDGLAEMDALAAARERLRRLIARVT